MITTFLSLIAIFATVARGAVRPWAFISIYIMVLIVLLLGILRAFSSKEIILRKTPLDLGISFILIIYIISMFKSGYLYGSIMELIRIIILASVFYIVINFVREEQDIKKLLNTVLISGAVISLFGILQYMGVIDKSWWGNQRFLSATYVNHNHFAGYIELIIPLSIGMALSEREMARRVFYIYIFLILSIAFLLSMSRGGWLSLLISLIFMAIIIFKKGKSRLFICMSALFFIILMIFVFRIVDTGLLLRRISSYKELDFSGRLEIWKGTLDLIKDHFIIGTGPGTFIYNFPRYRPMGLNMLVNYSHNDYLQVASEVGIFGFLTMVYIIWAIIKKGLNTHNIARTPFKVWISLSLATGILSMAIHGAGDFNFYIPANVILFTIFSAVIFNINSIKEKGCRVLILRPPAFIHGLLKTSIVAMLVISVGLAGGCIAAEAYCIASEKAMSKNDLDRAESCLYRSISLSCFNYLYYYKLARLYSKKASMGLDPAGNLKKSEYAYKKALNLNRIDSWAWAGLADTYYRLSQILPLDKGLEKSAEFSYRAAIELDPVNSYYLKNLARFLMNSGDSDLSSRMYKKAEEIMLKSKTLSLMPMGFADKEKYDYMAEQGFRSQHIDKAITLYRMAERFGSKKAILGQVRCYMKISNMRKAMEKFRQLEYSEKNKSILFSALSDYCLTKGMDNSAERFSNMSIRSDPSNPEGYQLRYKILKKVYGYTYPLEEARKLLGFNTLALTDVMITPEVFKAGFDVKENIHRKNHIFKDLVLPAGIYEVTIKAKGQEAKLAWPHMIIRFNGMDIMDEHVNHDTWRNLSGIIVVDYPLNDLEIVYDNDYYDEKTKEDRNLYIDRVELRAL